MLRVRISFNGLQVKFSYCYSNKLILYRYILHVFHCTCKSDFFMLFLFTDNSLCYSELPQQRQKFLAIFHSKTLKSNFLWWYLFIFVAKFYFAKNLHNYLNVVDSLVVLISYLYKLNSKQTSVALKLKKVENISIFLLKKRKKIR
jgi:hypothetical protein